MPGVWSSSTPSAVRASRRRSPRPGRAVDGRALVVPEPAPPRSRNELHGGGGAPRRPAADQRAGATQAPRRDSDDRDGHTLAGGAGSREPTCHARGIQASRHNDPQLLRQPGGAAGAVVPLARHTGEPRGVAPHPQPAPALSTVIAISRQLSAISFLLGRRLRTRSARVRLIPTRPDRREEADG